MSRGLAGGVQRLMHFFLPKEEDFFELFLGLSEQAHEGALVLQKMFAEGERDASLVEVMGEIEHAADRLRHDCVRRLNDTFVTPIMFDRQDILDLSDTLDDVVDLTRAAVDRTVLYQVQAVPEHARRLAAILVEATASLTLSCQKMAKMRTSDCEHILRVNELENEADAVLKQALTELFLHESNPVEIIKWKEIYDYVEEAIDHCEDTANAIEAALVKNS